MAQLTIRSSSLNVAMELSREIFKKLDHSWMDDDLGMWRPGFSDEETRAIRNVTELAASLKMEGYSDLAGNVFLRLPGRDPSRAVTMIGSHLYAVPHGGRYDGPVGVVSALAAARILRAEKMTPPQDLVVVIWRGEESPWFQQFAVGSKLATGALSEKFLYSAISKDTGESLATHLRHISPGFNALEEAAKNQRPLIPLDQIGRLIETHIEQAAALVEVGEAHAPEPAAINIKPSWLTVE